MLSQWVFAKYCSNLGAQFWLDSKKVLSPRCSDLREFKKSAQFWALRYCSEFQKVLRYSAQIVLSCTWAKKNTVPSGDKTNSWFHKCQWEFRTLRVPKPILEHNKMENKKIRPPSILLSQSPFGGHDHFAIALCKSYRWSKREGVEAWLKNCMEKTNARKLFG